MANYSGSQKNVFIRRLIILVVILVIAAGGVFWFLQRHQVFQKVTDAAGSAVDAVSDRVARAGGSSLTYAVGEIDGSFSPFTQQTGGSEDVVELTQVRLLGRNRLGMAVLSGIQGEKEPFNGREYTYYGPADLMIVPWEDGSVWYDFTLREDITFSDGVPLTVDDVIFTMYVLCDPSYEGSYHFGELPLEGLTAYQNGEADQISGIVRVDDHRLQLVLTKKDSLAVLSMMIPIAPLHYYGDAESYDYEKHQFGFTRGEVADLAESELVPLGAGPYCFASQKENTVSMDANPEYYLGAPQISYLDLKGGEASLDLLTEGQADILYADYKGSDYSRLRDEAAFEAVEVRPQDSSELGVLSFFLNAGRINVGGEPASEASKNLRKAIAAAFAFYRSEYLNQYYSSTVRTAEYPLLTMSLFYPQPGEEGYKKAYSTDKDGFAVGNSRSGEEEDVLEAIRGYLEAAGYVLEEGVAVAAPEGAALGYNMFNYASFDAAPIQAIRDGAAQLLAKVGIHLESSVDSDWETYNGRLEEGVDIFVLHHQSPLYPYPILGNYFAPNLMGLEDERLTDAIEVFTNAISKEDFCKEAYNVLDIILDWGVEVPIYVGQKAWYFDSKGMDADSLPGDMTAFYDWRDEIYRVRIAE